MKLTKTRLLAWASEGQREENAGKNGHVEHVPTSHVLSRPQSWREISLRVPLCVLTLESGGAVADKLG